TKLVDLGTIKLLKDCLCDDILYCVIMIGLVGVSALKFLETYIKRFNNLFFVFISTNIDDSPRKIIDYSSSCIRGLIFGSCSYMYYMSLLGQLYKPLHGYVHLAVTTLL